MAKPSSNPPRTGDFSHQIVDHKKVSAPKLANDAVYSCMRTLILQRLPGILSPCRE